MKNWLTILAALLVGVGIGFFVGRNHIDYTDKVTYEKRQTFKGYFPIIKATSEKLLGDFRFSSIEIPDGFVFPEDMTEDDMKRTTYDWNLERSYDDYLVFDNEYGRFTFDAKVQYNQLKFINPTFTPLQKIVTRTVKPVWRPFATASYNTLGYVSAGGGMIYHDIGVSVKYSTDFKQKGFDIGLLYLF